MFIHNCNKTETVGNDGIFHQKTAKNQTNPPEIPHQKEKPTDFRRWVWWRQQNSKGTGPVPGAVRPYPLVLDKAVAAQWICALREG